MAPPLAGASGASLARFLLFTSGGTLLWALPCLLGGYLFHDAIGGVLSSLTDLGSGALMIVGVALGLYIAFKWWQRRRFYQALRMARITVDELQRLIQEGKPPLVLDVRTAPSLVRDPRRIPGAVVLDAENLDARVGDLPTRREIILYCT